MILRRLGNKQAIAQDIIIHFPEHSCYFEPFFGTGSIFFNKPKVKDNFLNDLDSDVFNLFQIMKNNPEKLLEKLELTPYCEDVFKYFKKSQETCIYWKAIRFLYLSNFGFLGKPDSLKFDLSKHKKQALINYLTLR